MVTGSSSVRASENHVQAVEVSKVYVEGIIAGLIGAATIAIWFLILDVLDGRPLHTPTVLGTALFRQSAVPSTVGVCKGRPSRTSNIRNQIAIVAAPMSPAMMPST